MTGAGDGSGEVRTMSEPVELCIPVQSDLIVLARLTAATVASRAGFDVEEVDDLRLAVDELCVLVGDGGTAGRLNLSFITDGDAVRVICVLDGPEAAGEEGRTGEHGERELSVRILEALVDEHGEEFDGGQRRGWLRKRSVRHERS
jgi:serine/threonine-protein kinase RsbW